MEIFFPASFKTSDNVKDILPGQLPLQSQLDLTQELANYFFYALLSSSKCLDNNENMNRLKSEILEYLKSSNYCDITWSLLSDESLLNMQIASTFNDYFDFYILYYFYTTITNQSWSQTDLMYSYNWQGYNPYVKYLFNHQKKKKSQ